MKITIALIDKLIRLRDGLALPASALKGEWVEEMLRDGVMVSRSHGSHRALSVPDADAFLQALSRMGEGLDNLEQMRVLLAEASVAEGPMRASQAARTGNSKLVRIRSFPGFLVNSYMPLECSLNGKPFLVDPPEGSFVFIADWRGFRIPADVVVVGIENAENFRFVRRQRELFSQALPAKPLLFVSRYPQSGDLREWLLSVPNQYVHFGDLDLGGINIYQSEFYRHLGSRASFLIPDDFEQRIRQGSSERYSDQYRRFRHLNIIDRRLQPLADCIHKYHRCYDQEGWISLCPS